MRYLRVERSPLVQFLVGVVGLVLVLTALDLVWVHRLSTPPERTNGVLTSRGRGAMAADVVWGTALLLTGGALFGYAIVGLVRRRAVVVVDDEGLSLAVGGPGRPPVEVPWEDVVSVRCGFVAEGAHVLPALEVRIRRRGALPERPWGATWHGDTLVMEADDWAESVEEVAIHASLALERFRRAPGEPAGDGAS